MQSSLLSFEQVNAFPELFLSYINQNPALKPFYNEFPKIENFETLIKNRKFSTEKRQVLVETLKKQYANLPNQPDFDILLADNTFTVTTGHQLNIFTGPLYIIYKILTTINLAKQLKEQYPAYNFVPVYWMASEDHDFAEISSFNLFGKKLVWETTQTGAVGRMNPTELASVLEQINDKPEVFERAYLQNTTLADAVRQYMHEIFGSKGLVTIDADEKNLKRLFESVIKDDVLNQHAFNLVNEATQKLTSQGFKTQISPREINFFYLEDGLRERLVFENNRFVVQNTDMSFSKQEIETLIETSPEKFSPNVVLRPLYEEVILPNLAYIGGPSEVPYWLQLKSVFDFYGIDFPALIPRNFALVVNEATAKKAEKIGVSIEELFTDELSLKRNYIERISENTLNLSTENEAFTKLFEEVLAKAVKIDKTLEGAVQAERQKLVNSLENLEKRLKKSEERNHETAVNQLLTLKSKLFPNGGLQERQENVLNFWLNNPDFIEEISTVFEPLDFRFYVITP